MADQWITFDFENPKRVYRRPYAPPPSRLRKTRGASRHSGARKSTSRKMLGIRRAFAWKREGKRGKLHGKQRGSGKKRARFPPYHGIRRENRTNGGAHGKQRRKGRRGRWGAMIGPTCRRRATPRKGPGPSSRGRATWPRPPWGAAASRRRATWRMQAASFSRKPTADARWAACSMPPARFRPTALIWRRSFSGEKWRSSIAGSYPDARRATATEFQPSASPKSSRRTSIDGRGPTVVFAGSAS